MMLQAANYGKMALSKRLKKAQLKIQQMAFMLMALTIFFALVGMFIIAIKLSGLKESAAEVAEENALLLVTRIANSPEFSCGESFGTRKLNCIDTDKVMMLKKNIVKYNGFWKVSNIEIRKIFPVSSRDKLCTLGNYPDCNIIRLRPQNITSEYSNFVALCRKESFEGRVYDKCEIGKIMVAYSEK